jgi:oligopeptide/dipeptide ABC transporter ATP-binding protein
MLTVKGLRTNYFSGSSEVAAVRGVDLSVPPGSALALVGESGSGKSTVALSVMRLIKPPIGRIVGGSAFLGARDLLAVSARDMRWVLRNEIGYIPQDPTTALDPLFTVRTQIAQSLSGKGSKAERISRIVNLLDRLGVADAENRLKSYPHEFSGGMRQRVAIAIALAKDPNLLIADEPTTALDVTTQLGILKILDELRRERDLSMIFVTHDLSVAKLICQEIAVMYGGVIVERGPIDQVMKSPQHPYTRALLDADPANAKPQSRLRAISGQPPPLSALPSGCAFAPRCPYVEPVCETAMPEMLSVGAVDVRCVKPGSQS